MRERCLAQTGFAEALSAGCKFHSATNTRGTGQKEEAVNSPALNNEIVLSCGLCYTVPLLGHLQLA